MARNDGTSAIIDSLLRYMVTGGAIIVGLAVPNVLQVLDKPLLKYFDKLDRREREREVTRILRYMRSNKLIAYNAENYDHGIRITKSGRKRAEAADLHNLKINRQKQWDKKWRIVMFDIPESRKSGRDALANMLKRLGFHRLQKSVWLYPYPCRKEVAVVAAQYKINSYVTYLETPYLDNQKVLIAKFKLK